MRILLFFISYSCMAFSCTHVATKNDLLSVQSNQMLQICGKIQEARNPVHPELTIPGLEILLIKNGRSAEKQLVVDGHFCFDRLESYQDYTLVPIAPYPTEQMDMPVVSPSKTDQVYHEPSLWSISAQVACDPDKNGTINHEDLLMMRSPLLQTPGTFNPCNEWRFYNKDATSLQDSYQVYQLHFPGLQNNIDLTIYGLTGCDPE